MLRAMLAVLGRERLNVTGREFPVDSTVGAATSAGAATAGADELETLRSGVRLLALRLLGDLELAEEAAQETLARGLSALRGGQLREPQQLRAYVHGIARHVIADILRARRRHVGDAGFEAADPPSTAPDPLEAIISAEEKRRVHSALARLPARDLEIVRLSFFDGLTPGEIAARTGQPAARIRKRKSRALERLRQAFHAAEASGHDPPPGPSL